MSSNPSHHTTKIASKLSSAGSSMQTLSGTSLGGTRKRGPLFAAGFGLLMIGGIFYFVLSARSDGPEAAQATKVEAKPVAVAVATPAPAMKAPAPAPVISTQPVVHFAYKQATLNSDTRAALDLWADRMQKESKLTVTLAGHCDERGSERYNFRLGARRAHAAKAYLVSKGIAANRIVTVSFGKAHPAEAGHNEDAWSLNRRVELRSDVTVSQR